MDRISEVRLCAPVTSDGMVGKRWCKTSRVAVADMRSGEITGWQEFDVEWDRLHDEGGHDDHHERMAAFLRDHRVNVIVVDHIGSCLNGALTRMDIAVHPGASGEVRAAIVAASKEQVDW